MTFTPEFRLALDCCRWNFLGGDRRPVEVGEIDWALFLRLVRFHRIQGLVWRSLAPSKGALPGFVAGALSAESGAITASNLAAMAECRNLLQLFESAGAPLVFLKGLPLGVLAYGTSTVKASFDVDVLIDGSCLGQAIELLGGAGYALADPRLTSEPASLRAAYRFRKAFEWVRAGSPVRIDLHDRLSDNRRLLPGVGIGGPQQQVEVGRGIQLPALATEEMFAHLAVHGASSAWFRLKWISDFAALLAAHRADVDRLYRRSQELGAGRAAGQALLLADRLFGSLDARPELRTQLARDRATRLLAAAAVRQVSRREPREPTSMPWRTLRIHWTQLLLGRGASFALSEVSRQAAAAVSGRL